MGRPLVRIITSEPSRTRAKTERNELSWLSCVLRAAAKQVIYLTVFKIVARIVIRNRVLRDSSLQGA
jgi:hypothetical protein